MLDVLAMWPCFDPWSASEVAKCFILNDTCTRDVDLFQMLLSICVECAHESSSTRARNLQQSGAIEILFEDHLFR